MKDATEGKVTPVYLKLRGYQVQEVPEAAKPCAFSLVCGDVGRRPFVLAPERDSESERKRWMDAFTKAIEIHSCELPPYFRPACLSPGVWSYPNAMPPRLQLSRLNQKMPGEFDP